MRDVIDAIAAVLFVVSIGLLFSEAVRARNMIFTLVGILALASSYVIAKQVLDSAFNHRMHLHPVAASIAPVPTLPTAAADQSATDTLLEQVYMGTESALNRIVRAGTKQSAASVSSDTVVDVIVGMTIAILGLLSPILSGLYRRLSSAS